MCYSMYSDPIASLRDSPNSVTLIIKKLFTGVKVTTVSTTCHFEHPILILVLVNVHYKCGYALKLEWRCNADHRGVCSGTLRHGSTISRISAVSAHEYHLHLICISLTSVHVLVLHMFCIEW